MGTSTRPTLFTSPVSAKTLVPLDFSVPTLACHSLPRRMIWPMLARVSTLLSTLGLAQRPATAGKGGRGRGIPRFPSMEVISAVSSPQTKAPAPW